MQITKFRAANDNGLAPAGRYFAHLAAGLREANERASVVVDAYEEQERKLERRSVVKRRDTIPPTASSQKHVGFGMH